MHESGTRFRDFLKKENIQQTAVAEALQVRPQYINSLCTGRAPIGKNLAKRLSELYGVSAAWLLTGEGEMKKEVTEQVFSHPDVVRSYSYGVPYFNVDFAAGFALLENDQTRHPDYFIDFRPYNDCDCWVNIYGNSMHPTISSGDIVAMKRIGDIRYLINGEIYAIVTTNGLRTVKRIRDDGDTITLIPDNKEIAEQTIPKSIITHVFWVKGILKNF